MTVYLRKLQQSLITYFSAMTDRLHGFSSPHNLWSLSLFCVGLEFCAIWYLVTISFWTLLLLPSCFSRVRLCATPEMAAHQAPPSLGFSRQEHWSGPPFPSPMHESEKWKWSRSVVLDPQGPHGLQPFRLLHPWDFPGTSTGMGYHCLLLWESLESPNPE